MAVLVPYGVHMRNTPERERGSWATYVKAGRERVGLNKSEFGRRIGVDRATVLRWEVGRYRPDDADLVARVAEVLGTDLDETLAAAGLRPGKQAPATPSQEFDDEVQYILDADVSQEEKERVLEHLYRMRLRDKRRRREDIDYLLGRGRESA